MNRRDQQGILGTSITRDGSTEWLNRSIDYNLSICDLNFCKFSPNFSVCQRLNEKGVFGNESVPQFNPNQKWDGY